MTRTVRSAHSTHGAGNAPTSMAIAAGYFAERGIDAVMEEVPRTSDGIERVAAGEADFTIAAAAPAIGLAMRGGDPLVVMSIERHNIFGIIGAKGVRSPEDLRGRAVGILGTEDSDGIVMFRALREWGLDPDRDVEVVRPNGRGPQWEALVDGEIAAMASTAPQPILARAMGLPVLRDFTEETEPYQLGALWTTRRFADENPDVVRDYLSALLRGVKDFQASFESALPHLKARTKLDDIATLRETHRVFSEGLELFVPIPEALANVARDLEAVTGQPVDLDITRLVDASFVRAAAEL